MQDAVLVREVERLIVDYSDAWEGFSEETIDLGDVLARWNGYWGFASRFRIAAADVETRLDEVESLLAGNAGRRHTWVLGPSSEPADLAQRLGARGFNRIAEWDGLVLDDLTVSISSNPDVQIEEVSSYNAAEFAAFRVTISRGRITQATAEEQVERYLQAEPREALTHLARLDGRIVAYCVLRIEPNGVAYLRQGLTLPEMRNRGIYLALVAHRLRIAREAGCTAAVVQAMTASSSPILRKRGFRRVCGLTGYTRPEPTMEQVTQGGFMTHATAPTVVLTQEQCEFYHHEGYLKIDAITTTEEVEWLRGIYDSLFAARAGRGVGDHFDLAGTDAEGQAAALPQILNPKKYAPELNDGLFRVNALSIARQLLGDDALARGEHAIFKPARTGAETPWHQDEAYWDPDWNYESLSIWIPLQEATVENGCMQFVPSSHLQQVIAHHTINHDPRIHGLEADAIDTSTAVACPIPAGGATIHHNRILHYAGPNHSDIPRRAYILMFGQPPQKRSQTRDFYWKAQKTTAREQRAEQARRQEQS